MIGHVMGLIFQPTKQWQAISGLPDSTIKASFIYTLLMALLPAVAWYRGTTVVGWRIGSGDVTRLTPDSALTIVILFYIAMVASIVAIGYMIHWMAATYGANSTVAKGIMIAGFTATPLFLAGAVGFYPVFWLDLCLGMLAVSYALYLLYKGIPIVLHIPEERGFLFASAVLAVCLVILMMIMGGSVILWDMGAAPVFTD
jgi:Yip1 domain